MLKVHKYAELYFGFIQVSETESKFVLPILGIEMNQILIFNLQKRMYSLEVT